MSRASYVGRFAPSPTGPLHAGSLVAATASYLDARAHRGRWLLRIEDLDPPREARGASAAIIATLARLGFAHDGEVIHQSARDAAYRAAFERLAATGLVYPCACTRREVADSVLRGSRERARTAELIYPGSCRNGMPVGREARAWRVRVDARPITWRDRRTGEMVERLDETVGDFVLRRADGVFTYQLAVVVDDADQQISDVVRGEDLCDNTARQILLQRCLQLPTPRYLHTPLVLASDGQKLSKQTGAAALDTSAALPAMQQAARRLGLPAHPGPLGDAQAAWVHAWRDLYNPGP